MCNNKQKKRNNNNNKRSIITTLVVLAVCLVIVTGSTFSLFTSSTGVNIAITAANVQLVATIDETSIKYYSMDAYESNVKFENGGSADVVDGTITIDNITPGDKLTFNIKLNNTSTIDIQYRVKWTVEGALAGALTATADDVKINNGSSKWTSWLESAADEDTIEMAIEFPTDLFADKTAEERQKLYNDLQGKSANIKLVVEAVQGNADMPDEWNGTVPTEKPASLVVDTTAKLISINDADAFAYLNTLLNDGNFTANYGAKWQYTVELNEDIDLADKEWTPIVLSNVVAFDGKGHTISNLKITSGNDNAGLFGAYGTNDLGYGTIKNLTVDGAYVKGGNNSGVFMGTSHGTIENVTVLNATIEAGKYVGGLAGRTCAVKNCTIKNSTVVASNKTVGGLVGYCINDPGIAPATGNTVENVTVTGTYNVGGAFGQAQNANVEGNTVKNVTVISTKALPADASSNEVRTAALAARSAFANTTIGTNTVENVTCGIGVYGLALIPNGENSKIIVNDKEGFLNLTKLSADWRELFTDGNGNEWINYANGAGVDYYYAGRWTVSLEADIDLNNATIAPITIHHPVNSGEFTFNGNNHTIKNAKIVADATVESMTGLFNVTNEAFKNLKLDNIHVTGSNVGNSNAGILAGYCSGRIDNITITNSSVTGGKYTGGVVGSGYTDISNCTLTNVTVKGGYKLGGIIGYICAETGYTHNVTGNTLTDCIVDGIGGGVFAGGKTEYVIGQVVGNYNCNGTCNNNTVTNMTSSVTDAIGKIEAGKTVTQ